MQDRCGGLRRAASASALIRAMSRKDRSLLFSLDPGVTILWERSSHPPVEYAIVLLVERDGVRHTVRTFDNAHGEREHHEHPYVGDVKHPPVVTDGEVNTAMHAALRSLQRNWPAIVSQWETTR
jgi:hypothetical protein